jgi:hypothetical protein
MASLAGASSRQSKACSSKLLIGPTMVAVCDSRHINQPAQIKRLWAQRVLPCFECGDLLSLVHRHALCNSRICRAISFFHIQEQFVSLYVS